VSILQDVEWETCLLEPRPDPELERYARRAIGIPLPLVRYYSEVPWLVRAFVHFNSFSFSLAHTEPNLAALVALIVSQDNSCRNCFAGFRTILRILGYRDDAICKLEQDLFTAELESTEKAALDFARRVSRSSPPPGAEERAALITAGFSSEAVLELTALTSIECFRNRVATLPAIPPEPGEARERGRLIGLLAPVLRPWLRTRGARSRAEALDEESTTGPFSHLMRAFEKIPLAHTLHATLGDAWNSDHLTRRAKALVFAVVARGLGCDVTEREARKLLLSEGLEEAQIESILTNLSSAELDSVESAIVPYARETIRYQPSHIQRKGRAVRDALSNAQFLELIGVASLANAFSRLTLALDES
jgi:alkylhydroperoxidase family enzyme